MNTGTLLIGGGLIALGFIHMQTCCPNLITPLPFQPPDLAPKTPADTSTPAAPKPGSSRPPKNPPPRVQMQKAPPPPPPPQQCGFWDIVCKLKSFGAGQIGPAGTRPLIEVPVA